MRRTLSLTLFALVIASVAVPGYGQRYRYTERSSRSFDGQTMATVHLGISSATGDFGDVFDSGLGFGASIGYGVSRHVVLSANVSHHEFDSDFPDVEASTTPFTFNADYAFPTRGKIVPWIGGGIGVYNVELEIDDYFGPGDDLSEDESNFGFNLGAGIAGPISRRTLLGGGFRYHFVSEGDEFDDSPFFTVQFGLGFLL
jgi:opacity protein-like surface antigen